MIKLAQNELLQIMQHFPQLNCELNKQRIWGTLNFSCYYDSDKNFLEFKTGEKSITDYYEIEINFNEYYLMLPKTYERSGIILSYAKKNRIKLIDLHIFEDDSCCLGIYPEDENISAFTFLTKRVVPYFYWQSHFRLYGEAPWLAYSHGLEGFKEKKVELEKSIDEKYNRLVNRSLTNTGSFRNQKCICGSGKKYKKCCLDNDNRLRSNIILLQNSKVIVEKLIEDGMDNNN